MKAVFAIAVLVCASAASLVSGSSSAFNNGSGEAAHESRIPVGGAQLYAREIGKGTPIIVLHGGPDFDHSYLLPELDRLMRTV